MNMKIWMMSVYREMAPKRERERESQVVKPSSSWLRTHMYSSGKIWFLWVPPIMDCESMIR